MQDIHSWRRPAEAAANVSVMAADELTAAFFRNKCLEQQQLMVDGFQDAGGHRDPRAGKSVGAADATLLVDRVSDGRLSDLCDFASKQLRKTGDAVTRVMVTALIVSDVLGRSGGDGQALEQRCEEMTLERMDRSRGLLRIGELLGDRRGVAARDGHGKQQGAGWVRHRAVLFKALADWLEAAPSVLKRSIDKDIASTWNTVNIDNSFYVVDVMFDPGALYEEGSARASAYVDCLKNRPKAMSAAPSVKQGVSGQLARPPWHVEPWEVEFDRGDRAGRGGFGEVFKGKWAGQPVAVKEVKDASPTDADVCNFVLEISLLSGLSHPNIVRFWRGCVDLRGGSRTLLLLTEWMDRGVLSELLHEVQGFTLESPQRFVLAMGVARGAGYLHDVGVLHLDLKSPNVLLNSTFQVKLCDFGLAKVREQVGGHTTLVGVSPAWAPPEMFDDTVGTITEKADVYSFGIIVFELFTQEVPFSDLNQMQMSRAKAKGQMPKNPPNLDEEIRNFLQLCLALRPSARPSMQTAISQLKQIAKQRKTDLQAEQAQMEARGYHPKNSGGSQSDQMAVEAEVARLKKLLEEEKAKLRLVEQQVRETSFGKNGQDAEKFCAQHTARLEGLKFQCTLCMKLFRGEEFVHKHIKEKHFSDMMLGLEIPARDKQAKAKPAPSSTDGYFDTDVAEEGNARMYTVKSPSSGQLGQMLFDAATAGDLEKVQQCLRQDGAMLNARDSEGCTALHLCACQARAEVARHLISSAADLSLVNENGLTALHLAAQEGHLNVCEVLLQGGAPFDARDSAKSRMPLHLAAAGAHIEPCRALLAHKAAVNAHDNEGASALHNAARSGSRALCDLILSYGAQVNAADNEGWSPLHEASRWGDGELVEALLQRRADPLVVSNDGEGALHVVPGGYAEHEVIEVLIGYRANLNGGDYEGETPLHVAVRLGDDGLAEMMLEKAADVNAKTKLGATPLDLAKKDEIRWLLREKKGRRGAG